MIKCLPGFPDNVIAVICQGHVTRADYETVLIPRVEQALEQYEKVRLYYQIDTDFSGFDPGAMWADTKVGMAHLHRWERMAVVTDVDWIKNAMKYFGFLFPVEMKTFPIAEIPMARDWILNGQD